MTLSLQEDTYRMITRGRQMLLIVVALCISYITNAQFYPVQTTTQLIPPYSVYLSDYATGGNEKLRVILLQRDLTQPSYQLRLVMTVELNGRVIMRTSRAFTPPPINLNPGIPTVISGAELAPYVDSRNIDFVGYSRDQYERTKALPEGSYQITFTAYDYRRQDVQVSNAGISFYYLSKNEPPLINFPACGTKVPMRTPQQIIFSWLSRNTASPNSAADTEFELTLYETRPEGRNPNDVVLSTQPVFRITVDLPQYIYNPSDPLLLSGMKYVWRVRAIDRNGKDAFRNNGYSEVCTFTYGGTDPDFDLGVVKNLQAEGETERKGRIWWDTGEYDGYVASYRKTGEGFEWFTSIITTDELKQAGKTQGEVKLFDLEPYTEYETRVQPKKSGFLGAYTDIVKFRTKPHVVAQCGVNPNLLQADLTKPLRSGIKGMLIQVDDIEIQLMDVLHLGDGWYKGTGRTSIPYFGGAVFAVVFDRLYIDESRVAGLGRIDFVTQGVAALVEQQSANLVIKKKEAVQQANRETWDGTDFYEKVFVYDDIVITNVTADGSGTVSIVDNASNVTVNTQITAMLVSSPEKAIIIQDKNGDQYVVEKVKATGETKVTKVEGGGLNAASNIQLSKEENDILRKALRELEKEYKSKFKTYSQETDIVTYNTTRTIIYFADDTRNKEGYQVIASGLQVKGEKVLDYLAKAREQKETEETQIKEVKIALVEIISKSVQAIYSVLNDFETEIASNIGDEHSLIYRRGGTRSNKKIVPLPTCFDKKDLPIIRDYISLSKIATSKTAGDFLSSTLASLAGTIVSYSPDIVLSAALCPLVYKGATEYYIQARLEDDGFVKAGETLTGCALEGFKRGLGTTYGTIELKAYTALLQTGLCLTAQDKCVGDAYWTQFGYGATNALLQELDVAAMVDGVLFIIGTQLKNQFECVKKGGFVYLVVTAATYEDAVLAASQCLLGVNMSVQEWKALYAKSKDYILKNWDEPYLHGQATVFVATILIPYTKLSKVTKLKLLTKLRGNTNFVNKIDELEKLSKLADEGGDVGKVMDDIVKGGGNYAKFLDDAFTQARKAEVIAENLPTKFPNHTLDELTAIKTYTSDEIRNGTKIYESLNTQLRAGNLDDFNKGLNELLNSGLNKLTPYKGSEVFRGVSGGEADIAKTWKIGDGVVFKDFKSSSIKESVAVTFTESKGGNVIFEISNPKGYNICDISCLPGEAEVLFKSGSQFKVKELTYLPRIVESDPLIRVIKLEFVK